MSIQRLATFEAGECVAWLVTVAVFIATFLLTRQTQIEVLGGLAAPWALAMVILRLRWQPSLLTLAPMFGYALCSMTYSLSVLREPTMAVRFFAITMGTLAVFYCRPARISALWALMPVTVQAIAIAAIAIALGLAQDTELAATVRGVSLEAEWGDIYSFDGIYYRVQLIGNALIPLLFLICLQRHDEGRRYRVTMWISVAGLIAAGNLTYFLVAGLAVALRFRVWFFKRGWRRAALVALTPLLVVAVVASTEDAFSTKFDGPGSSMAVRFDQIAVVVADLQESPLHLLVGAGLGAPFPDGRERDYSTSQYIEVQALYLFLQLGSFGSLLYIGTLIESSRRCLAPAGRSILWLYLLGGSTNPYILDSNQLVATFILLMLFPKVQTPPAPSVSSQTTNQGQLSAA